MKKIFIGVCLLLCACTQSNKHSHIAYTEINNQELKNQISQYMQFIDSIEPNQERLFTIKFKKENDSTVLFDISNEIYNVDIFDHLRFTFISKVEERDVIFFDDATQVFVNLKGRYYFFQENNQVKEEIIKSNFPNNSRRQYKESDVVAWCIYEPDNFHLVFVNDKLVSKEIRRGLMWLP